MLRLSQADVDRLLPMNDCIDVMAAALTSLARGDAALPLRTIMRIPKTENFFAAMPGYVELNGHGVFGAKLVTVFPGNHGTAYDSHQGAVLIFDNANGGVAAMLDGTAITSIRTAAVSGVSQHVPCRAKIRRRSRSSAPACKPTRIFVPCASCGRFALCAFGVAIRTTRESSRIGRSKNSASMPLCATPERMPSATQTSSVQRPRHPSQCCSVIGSRQGRM
jgi:hypothetical protein